jgi:mono/diheme cytochrome c family protein
MIAIHVSSPRIAPWIAASLVALIVLPLSAQPSAEPPPGDYRVVGGKVDRGTYTGWRLFHSACYGCHGVDAVGTDLAPNLVERVKTLTPRAFATRVLTSYRIVLPANEANTEEDRTAAREAMVDEIMRRERGSPALIVMPAWGIDPKVTPHVLDLYAYLSARADGKLGPGKPKLLVEKKR